MKEKMKVKKISKITNIVTKVLLVATVLVLGNNTVFGADDPLSVIKNLQNFIFSIIQAVGIILVAWGIVQVGLALKSHDPQQRASGFFSLAGGIIIAFTKQVLEFITK